MPIPPSEFVAKLKQYDPLLRVRWGTRTERWIIERKMPERHKQLVSERPSPFKSPRGLDVAEGWRDGYVHVLSVDPSMLDNRVFDVLNENDSWRIGGMEKLSREIDRIQAQEAARVDRGIETWNQSAARDMHDQLQWGLGNRIGLGPDPSGIGPSDHVEQHEGFTVIDKRGLHLVAGN